MAGTNAPKEPTAEERLAALEAELEQARKERDELEAENNALRDAGPVDAEPEKPRGVLTANAAGKIVGDHAKKGDED